MAEYTATVGWERAGARFVENRYSRAHKRRFDGGARVPVVPLHPHFGDLSAFQAENSNERKLQTHACAMK